MSAALEPGMWVRCVDARPDPWGRDVPLRVAGVYQIETVWSDLPHGRLGRIWTDAGLDLVGVRPIISPEGVDHAYGAYRFRPLDDPKPQVRHRHAERETEAA